VVVVHGKLIVGERLQLISKLWRSEIVVGPNGCLEIGDRVFINHGCSIGATELIRIGSRCHIGTQVQLMDNDWHYLEPERRNERPPSRPIVLEENVWLASRVIVLGGVTIGEGSVIGAGSVVVSDVPARSLAVGSPARVIRTL
jgi:maltose O-acetyltransferase